MARASIGGRRNRKTIHTHKMNVKKGDRVKIIRGNYAGMEGTVLRVIPQDNRVVVEGVNERIKHVRPTQENPEGGRVTMAMPIHASNVMRIDPATGEPTRKRNQA
jgi:large subunit ribosomal protein L24